MYSWIYGEVFKLEEILKIINEIDEKRKQLKNKKTTFAEDLILELTKP